MKRKHEPDTSSQDTSTQIKKQRQDGDLSENTVGSRFKAGLFDRETLVRYQSSYQNSSPFLHGVIPNLISDSLLRSVRNEIQTHISFTPKETDIYKIHQSGDLANLDGLDSAQLTHLPSLVELRDALYSLEFRNFLEEITGAGKLSGRKTDMAINVYTPGTYLLCHDDVIGTRRVSYILYLTDPDEPWQASWGGGLRLYATESRTNSRNEAVKVPMPEHIKTVPPSWGQLSFFAVQPGESFHDVEEVYHPAQVGEKGENRVRMAISGWYHIPVEGEEGYERDAEQRLAKGSSLAQLESQGDEFDEPRSQSISFDEFSGVKEKTEKSHKSDAQTATDDSALLTAEDFNFLLGFISPAYLTPDMTETLAANFEDHSFIQLGQFLCPKFADALRDHISKRDGRDDAEEPADAEHVRWKPARPPHKHRYLYLQAPQASSAPTDSPSKTPGTEKSPPNPFEQLITELFPSPAFRQWLSLITNLRIDGDATLDILARRFRKGKDYALASAYSGAEAQLEFSLGCTPSTGWAQDEEDANEEDAEPTAGSQEPPKREASAKVSVTEKPEAGEATGPTTTETQASSPPAPSAPSNPEPGGEEVYMANDEADDASADISAPADPKPTPKVDPAIYASTSAEDAEDAILFSDPPAWNRLSIVLRDRATLRFVKYVSRGAGGDRWDVKGVVRPGAEGWGEGDEGDGVEEEEKGEEEEWEGLGESEASTVGLQDSESESEESVY